MATVGINSLTILTLRSHYFHVVVTVSGSQKLFTVHKLIMLVNIYSSRSLSHWSTCDPLWPAVFSSGCVCS